MKKSHFLLFLITAFFMGCENPVEPDDTYTVNVGDLIITEVGNANYPDDSVWIEVYNISSSEQNLKNCQLVCYAANLATNYTFFYTNIRSFALPNRTISPGEFILIRGDPYNDRTDSDQIVFVNQIQRDIISVPYIDGEYFFEIRRGNNTIDFVRGGGSDISPTAGTFTGNAPALPANRNDYGRSVARQGALVDNDTGEDWNLVDVSTPGGPNDVTNATDSDGDGIPDANESPGSTFAGLPLYDWGARSDVRDIFIHINYMGSRNPAIIPKKEALDMIVEAFSNKNIRLHFDVGDLFDQSPGIDAADYDLSDASHEVPFASTIAVFSFLDGIPFYNYKSVYMPGNRKQVFHYMIFANQQYEPGILGIAEIGGNDSIISLGGVLNANTPERIIITEQAGTAMHELGHNLGLRHGGDDDENYKPNYYSVMNYLYASTGLPPAGNPGDRYYLFIGYGEVTFSNLSDGPFSDSFKIDYSDGSGASLNENNLNESMGIGRSLGSIDWNTNGDPSDSGVSHNINSADSPSNGLSILRDYDDWGNLYFTFYRTYSGDTELRLSFPHSFIFKTYSQKADQSQIWLPPCRF